MSVEIHEGIMRRAFALGIVSLMVLGSLLTVPSLAAGEPALPDLVVRSIGWIYPVETGEPLPILINLENIGDANVQDGFWVELQYAELPGFWQETTESHYIWVEPPIRAGEVKAVETTITALGTHQINFKAIADPTGIITEQDEINNAIHRCFIGVGAVPGSSVRVPIYLRNEMVMSESFTVEVDETSIPDGWGFEGGLPPTTITAAPGGNVVLNEVIHIPAETILNPVFIINVVRLSDGDSQSLYIKVVTTPEMGFSFNPYLNEFSVWCVDHTQQWDRDISSKIIYKNGPRRVEQFTVTHEVSGDYVKATLEILHTRQLFKYKILEIDYNGVATMIPEENEFKTTFLIRNGQLMQFRQEFKYNPDMYATLSYDSKTEQTLMTAWIDSEEITTTYDGWQSLGSRIESGNLIGTLLDVREPTQPYCPNKPTCGHVKFCGWTMV